MIDSITQFVHWNQVSDATQLWQPRWLCAWRQYATIQRSSVHLLLRYVASIPRGGAGLQLHRQLTWILDCILYFLGKSMIVYFQCANFARFTGSTFAAVY